jgi:hypothetical protein
VKYKIKPHEVLARHPNMRPCCGVFRLNSLALSIYIWQQFCMPSQHIGCWQSGGATGNSATFANV